MFEWDQAKSAGNKLKHRISFEEAEAAMARNGIKAVVASIKYPGQRILIFRADGGKLYCAATEERNGRTRIITVHRDRKLEKKYGP